MDNQIPKDQLTTKTATSSQAMPLTDAPLSIHLTIRDPQKVVFDNIVEGITSINKKGVFDVLPLHENFISTIEKYITIHTLKGEKQTINIDNGIIYVSKNEVRCYINLLTAEKPEPGQTPTAEPANQPQPATQTN